MSEPTRSAATSSAVAKRAADPKLKDLKARAQLLQPLVRVSHEGVNAGVLKALNDALDVHGLVKVRFVALKEQKKELAQTLQEKTDARLVLQVGHTATYYRPPRATA